MDSVYTLTAVIALLLVALVFVFRRRTSASNVPVLTPKLAELVQSSQHDGLCLAHDELGDVFRLPGSEPIFYFRNADTVGRLCTDNSFVKNDAVYKVVDGVVNVSNLVQPLLNNTLFQKDGPEWKQTRKDINPLFASPDYTPVALELMSRHLATIGDGAECDLQEELHVVLQQAVMRLMTGIDMPDEAAADYAECIKHFGAKTTTDLSQADAAMLLKVYPHALAAVQQVRELGPSSTPTISRSLLGLMLKADRYTDDEMARTLVNMIVAGAESPAAGIAKTIAGVAAHPKVLKKIHEELDTVVGKRAITSADVPQFKYLENVLKEGHRRWDPATVISRRVKADVELDGVRVPAGSLAVVCVHAVHMDKRQWDRPDDFVPERFEGEIHPFAWVPFGGGPRGCPGKRATMLLGKAILGELYSKYDVALQVPLAEMDKHVDKYSSWSGIGVPVSLRRRC